MEINKTIQKTMDPELPNMLSFLRSKRTNEIFHKDSTFYSHLLETYRILAKWKVPRSVARFALCHSIYGNSWVDLSVVKDRSELQHVIGNEAENLVFLFCTIDRLETMHECDKLYQKCVKNASNHSFEFPDFLLVNQIKLTKREIAIFLCFTIADFLSQFRNYQDQLFCVEHHKDLLTALLSTRQQQGEKKENPGAFWPGNQPGLFLHLLSRLAFLVETCKQTDIVCPLFQGQIISFQNEKHARDLYVGLDSSQSQVKNHIHEILQCNPYLAEPHNKLAQVYLAEKKFDLAFKHASRAYTLSEQWQTAWDKNVSFKAWRLHHKMLIVCAREQQWPIDSSMKIISLGMESARYEENVKNKTEDVLSTKLTSRL